MSLKNSDDSSHDSLQLWKMARIIATIISRLYGFLVHLKKKCAFSYHFQIADISRPAAEKRKLKIAWGFEKMEGLS